MYGGTGQLPKGMRLRTGPSRSGYVLAGALWVGGWLGLFGYGHFVWWRFNNEAGGQPAASPDVIPRPDEFPVDVVGLGMIALGFVVWLVVNRARASAQKRLPVAGFVPGDGSEMDRRV